MSSRRVVAELKLSSRRVGRLYPILLDTHGNIIDGQHRFAADANWPKMRLEYVETEKDRLLLRLLSNVCRRNVSAKEKKKIVGELGEIYLREGDRLGRIANRISEETGMSYRWTMKYLPDHLKERPGLGGPSKAFELDQTKEKADESGVARYATGESNAFIVEPPEKIVTVKNYGNTQFVNIILERGFYIRLEKIASKLGASTDTIITNALILTLKQLESVCERRARMCTP